MAWMQWLSTPKLFPWSTGCNKKIFLACSGAVMAPVPSSAFGSTSLESVRDLLSGAEDPMTLFEISQIVGAGSYGEVFKARHLETGATFAIKSVAFDRGDNVSAVLNEVAILRKCRHPNIVAYVASYLRHGTASDYLWIVMEFCSGGSVDAWLRLNKRPRERDIAAILWQACNGLQYLHSLGHMHRDLKAANLLLTGDGFVKLADFGVATQITKTLSKGRTFIGTPYWMAPEVVASQELSDGLYDQRADIWSLGITAIELAAGKPPLHDLHPMKALFLIPTAEAPVLGGSEWSGDFADFCRCCLQKDPTKRISLAEALEHSFFRRWSVAGREGREVVKAMQRRGSDCTSEETCKNFERLLAISNTDDGFENRLHRTLFVKNGNEPFSCAVLLSGDFVLVGGESGLWTLRRDARNCDVSGRTQISRSCVYQLALDDCSQSICALIGKDPLRASIVQFQCSELIKGKKESSRTIAESVGCRFFAKSEQGTLAAILHRSSTILIYANGSEKRSTRKLQLESPPEWCTFISKGENEMLVCSLANGCIQVESFEPSAYSATIDLRKKSIGPISGSRSLLSDLPQYQEHHQWLFDGCGSLVGFHTYQKRDVLTFKRFGVVLQSEGKAVKVFWKAGQLLSSVDLPGSCPLLLLLFHDRWLLVDGGTLAPVSEEANGAFGDFTLVGSPCISQSEFFLLEKIQTGSLIHRYRSGSLLKRY